MSTHVFAGPTIAPARIRALLPSAVLHPPVQHGDVLRLGLTTDDRVLIIDGLWHQSLPVRHKEILMLLAEGVEVSGAASMGALRAAELASYGMVGIGHIFRGFRDGRLDADDEVAVLQGPDGRALTQALVNLRCAFQRAAAAGGITDAQAIALTEAARAIPYPRRTWTALGRAVRETGLRDAYEKADIWRCENAYDQKREDAEAALRLLALGTATAATMTPQWSEEPWETSFVRYWSAAYHPATDTGLPLLALLQHQQLYDPDFPQRWRTRVLSRLASHIADPSASTEAAISHLAERLGLDLADLSAEQLAYWLTPDELNYADRCEQLVRLVVRTARLDDAWPIWPCSRAEAGALFNLAAGTEEKVTAALRTNASAEAADPRHSIAHLAPARIAAHLFHQWELPPDADQSCRDAAARDRAFRSFASAVETGRTFYLGAVTRASSATGTAGASDNVLI
ncbi:TfuA-like protein [Streptomyces sp. NPDC059743]|uniref:TfuA-like protein n=1 Tax=Streptomyces sp. NPDC059743 TaxID=3346928 RepID=UPI00364A4B78